MISLLVGAGLMIAPAVNAATAPLAPGGAAGVKQAQMWGGVPIWAYVGGVLVIVGFVAVLSDTGNGTVHTTTTTTGP